MALACVKAILTPCMPCCCLKVYDRPSIFLVQIFLAILRGDVAVEQIQSEATDPAGPSLFSRLCLCVWSQIPRSGLFLGPSSWTNDLQTASPASIKAVATLEALLTWDPNALSGPSQAEIRH